MVLYDYRCEKCGHEWEAFAHVEDRYKTPCPICGHSPSKVVIRSGNSLQVKIFPAGIWEHIAPEPLEITSRRQLREECKKHGCYAKYDDGIAGF